MARRVIAAENVLVHQFADEAAILNLNTETYYRLNSVGIDMWQALTNSPSVEAAHTQLLAQYEVDAEQLQQDIDEFINSMLELQLVTVQA